EDRCGARRGRPDPQGAAAHAAAVGVRGCRVPGPAGPHLPRRHLHRAGVHAHRADRHRPRHRRQRVVLPGPRRGVPLAAAQRAGAGGEGLGRRPPVGPGLLGGQPLLVVRDGRGHRDAGDAAADLPRRRAQVAGRVHPAAGAARPAGPRARRLPAVHVLGADRRHHLLPVDRPGRPPGARHRPAEPHARLPAAPGLRPPAVRPGRPGGGGRRGRAGRGAGAAAGRLHRVRRGGGGAVRVRDHAGLPAGRHQPGAAPGRAAGGVHPGRHGVPRPVDVPRLRRRRPPGRPRLRPAARRRGRGPVTAGRAARGRLGARRGRRQGRPRGGPRARRRAGVRGRPGRLVHLLLLARRRPRPRLRPRRRDPPQARLRPGRALLRPGRQAGQGEGGGDPAAQEGRPAVLHVGGPARPLARPRFARPAAGGVRRRRLTRAAVLGPRRRTGPAAGHRRQGSPAPPRRGRAGRRTLL
ncbi:MAG: FIG00907047: phosphodiesterase/nucleotide pyrophosphatase, partial [uncultured Corynebacteriales bacterium]